MEISLSSLFLLIDPNFVATIRRENLEAPPPAIKETRFLVKKHRIVLTCILTQVSVESKYQAIYHKEMSSNVFYKFIHIIFFK